MGIPLVSVGLLVLGGTILAHGGWGPESVLGNAPAGTSGDRVDVRAVQPALLVPVPTPLPGPLAGPTRPAVVPVLPTASTLATPTTWPPPCPPAHDPPTRIVAPSIGLDQEVMPVGWHQEEQGGRAVSPEGVPSGPA